MTTNSNGANSVDAKVRTVIEKELRIDISKFDSEANLYQTAGIDSMGMLDIVVGVEQEFNILIHRKDFSKITSVRSIVELVGQYIAEGQA